MIKFKVIEINSDGDSITGLYKNGDLIKYGDYYHDKIDDWINGYMKCLDDNDMKYKLVTESYNDEDAIEKFDCYLPDTLVKFYNTLDN